MSQFIDVVEWFVLDAGRFRCRLDLFVLEGPVVDGAEPAGGFHRCERSCPVQVWRPDFADKFRGPGRRILLRQRNPDLQLTLMARD